MQPTIAMQEDEYAARQNKSSLQELGQALVNLTEANIRALLSEAVEELLQPQRRAEASAVLAQLATLNPSLATHFRLKEDILAVLPLRMVCSPRPESVPSFIVVSYCWHHAEWPMSRYAQPIAPGWKISLPMVHAVMKHRQSANEGVWVDQLCIDQDDGDEKVTHIGAMNVIYRAARRVVILLEDVELSEDEHSTGLLYAGFYADLTREAGELDASVKGKFIDAYMQNREKTANLGPDVLQSVRSFARKMMGARWYSRAWCAHESRTAPHRKVDNPLLLCYGHDGTVLSFEFRFIHFLGYQLCKSEPPEPASGETAMTSANHTNPTSLRHRWWRMILLMPQQSTAQSPMQHIVSVLSFGCFKKGDLVSIALNTWGLPLVYDGDPQSVEQAIVVFSLLVLASGDLTPLVMSGSQLKLPDGRLGDATYSWLMHPLHGVADSRMPLTIEGSITSATADYIELDLLLFAALPSDASPESFQKAATFIEQQGLMDIHREITAAADDEVQRPYQDLSVMLAKFSPGRPSPLQTFHQRFLALALDCGLDWMLRFADTMGQESWSDWAYGSLSAEPNPNLVDIARSLLALFDVQNGPTSVSSGQVDKASRFLGLLLDPRLVFLGVSPRRIQVGPGPANSAIVPSVSNRCWYAVPAAVAHLPAWQERAWVVERVDKDGNPPPFGPLLTSDFPNGRVVRPGVDDTGNWQVKRRERIYAADLRPLTLLTGDVEGKCVTHLKKQRVYGAEDYDWRAAREAVEKME